MITLTMQSDQTSRKAVVRQYDMAVPWEVSLADDGVVVTEVHAYNNFITACDVARRFVEGAL